LVIALNYSALKELEKCKIKSKSYHDYLTPSEFENINRAAYSLMRQWPKHGNMATIESLSLVDLLSIFYNLFSIPIKQIELVEKAISVENPTKVICLSNSNLVLKVAQHVCNKKNIVFQSLKNSATADAIDFLMEYISITGSTVLKNIVVNKLKISKFFKESSKPVSSALIMNLFNDIYPFLQNIKLDSLVLPFFDAFMPKYYLQKSSCSASFSTEPTYPEKKILVLLIFENSVKTLALVIEELAKKYSVKCVVSHPDSIQKCLQLKIPFETIGNYATNYTISEIEREVSKIRSIWSKISNDQGFAKLFKYKVYSLFDEIEPSLFLLFNSAFVYAISFVKLMRNVLEIERPNIVIVPDDTGLAGKTLVKLAKKRHIPTLTVQHGTIDDVLNYMDVQSDIIAVWGKISKNLLIENGVPPNKLVITGMPVSDMILTRDRKTKSLVYEKWGISRAKKIAVWTPSPYDGIRSHDSPKINEQTLKTLSAVFRAFPDKQLVVKLHPLDSDKMYKKVLAQIGDKHAIVIKHFDTYDLLYSCEFLMVCNSTTGVEAMILDKPVIVVNLFDVPENVPYARSGAALRATNKDELIWSINAISKKGSEAEELQQKRRKFVDDYAYKIDGQASKRIVEVVDLMMKGSNASPLTSVGTK
jgi:UDP-N-acetylglucosamine 2-epimerase